MVFVVTLLPTPSRSPAFLRSLLGCALMALLLIAADAAQAAHYIRDVVYVPLRSGPTSQHRILDNLKSGDRVQVVEGDFATAGPADYLRVTTAAGTSGWIEKQYLVSEPVARQRLDAVEAELALAERRNNELQQQLKALSSDQNAAASELERLRETENELREELETVRAASAEGLRLHAQHQQLSASNAELAEQNAVLRQENDALRGQLQSDEFMHGAYAVGIGAVLALIIPRLWPRRRRSEWI
ncbi:MAG: TIGR04211 family SH3 domain-containing protein [Spongiibacteraceae bacterium]|nr:TIGR04211 family SH3 domain-containing protein [Spongiibacteraceae bacterium]